MLRVDRSVWWPRLVRFGVGAGGTLLLALTGVIRNKWFASHLETSGIGVLAQVISGQAWLGTAGGLGLSLPVANAVSAASAPGADPDSGRRAAWGAGLIACLAGAGLAVSGLLAAPSISRMLLGTEEHAALVRLSMIGVAGLALWTPTQGFFAGRSDVGAPLTFALVGGGSATIAAIVLVPRHGLAGAVAAVSLLYPLGLAGTLLRHARRHASALQPRPRPLVANALRQAAPLVSAAGAALAVVLLDLGIMVALRAHYLKTNGVAANGLVQAALAISQQIGAIFYAYLNGYAFGRVGAIAAAEGTGGVTAYTRRHWTPLLLLASLAVGLATIAASPILHLLYSARFDEARPLLAFTLWGELGRVAAQILAIGALAAGGTRLWFAVGLAQPLALAASYVWLARTSAGTSSLPIAYAAAGWFTFAVALVLLARHGVTLRGRALALVGLAFAVQALIVRLVVL